MATMLYYIHGCGECVMGATIRMHACLLNSTGLGLLIAIHMEFVPCVCFSLAGIMQWRVSLLVGVAIASGLMSLLHLYLLSTNSHNSISVAVEIPLGQAQHPHSTNLELNIKSLSEMEKLSVGTNDRAHQTTEDHVEKPVQISALTKDASHSQSDAESLVNTHEVVQSSTQASHIPLGTDVQKAETEVMEEEDILWRASDDYTVLLDTEDYELEEQEIEDGVTIFLHNSYKNGRTVKQELQSTESQHQTLMKMDRGKYISRENSKAANDVSDSVQVHNNIIHLTDNGSVDLTEKQDKVKSNVIVLTKEEYYARQVTQAWQTHHTPSSHKTAPSHHVNPAPIECTVLPCVQYLSMVERSIYKKCRKRATPHKSTRGPPPCQCKFRDGTGKKRVALVSLPGSGNTWVRGLLEKVTGLCTGSIYCDRTLREGGFCGEGLRGTSLVAVKTHDSSLYWRGGKVIDPNRPPFDKAIFLIRNPFRAIIAEWNRQMSKKYASNQTGSSHIKYISNKAFFGNQPGWQAMVKYLTHKWKIMIGSNLKARANRPVLVVFFEDLKVNPAPQLTRMLEFLEVSLSPATINATVMDGFSSYYRNHTDMFEHYTVEQKAFVNGIIIKTADTLKGLNVPEHIVRHIRDYSLPSNTMM